jgi:hypothetical protein
MTSATSEMIISDNARPACNRPLPPLKPEHKSDNSMTILLFYQYIEPLWTKAEHKHAIKKVIEIGTQFNITGRGRVGKCKLRFLIVVLYTYNMNMMFTYLVHKSNEQSYYHDTAREGLNCTLTGRPEDIRAFCQGLRNWKSVFNETDFKLTDGLPISKMFKALSIRKANELVAYGLAGGESFLP